MTDRITQCDVVDCCEDCQRYADDCDGDKYLDRYPTMHEYADGKRINPKLTDLISRVDAIKAVASITMSIHLSDVICDKLLALPSADTVQGEWLDGWEVIRELSETRCMYNCFDENDRPMYEAMTSAIDIVRQMIGGDDE